VSALQGQPPSDTLLADGPATLIAGLLVLALALATAAAPLLRRYYKRRVRRLMGLNQVAPPPVAAAAGDAAQALEQRPAPPSGRYGAEALASLARQREHRVTRATVFAWLTFAGLAPVVAGVDPQAGLAARLGFLVMAALLALIPALTNLPEDWNRRPPAAALAGRKGAGQAIRQPLWLARVGTYLALWYRRLRGQVLPMFVVLAAWLLLFLGTYAYMEARGGDAWLTRLDEAEEGSSIFTTAQLTVPLFWALCLWVAFRLLDGLAGLIRRGWVSELSLGSAVSLIVVAFIMVAAADERHSFWSACAPLLWVAAALGAYALALGRPQGELTGPQLLVLRVFSEDTSQQKLLDQLQARWRYVGPVHQIGGPDMVDLNVDPYEASMFLGNRLHELFLPLASSLSQLKRRLQPAPDHEGRYFINEVFCFNTAWRSTVDQLMHLSDAIVLDLRGLTAHREGTSFEIRVIARAALLDKVRAVVDDTTDWAHVERLLRAEGADPGRLVRLNVGKDPQSEELFTGLLQAVAPLPSA
jgi:hypothetical protein